MKRQNKNKKGFTLVEVMLAVAIILLIGSIMVAVMVAIKDSWMTTYNQNDAVQYAQLFGRGFENSFLKHTANKTSGSWSVTGSVLQESGTEVFSPRQMSIKSASGGTVDKWDVSMSYKFDNTKNLVSYRVYIKDNYYDPGKLLYVYGSSFWVPHFETGTINASGGNADTEAAGYTDMISYAK